MLDQGAKPDAPKSVQWFSFQEVVLRTPLPLNTEKSRFLEQSEMLGKRLPRQSCAVPSRQPNVQFKQSLTVSFCQFINEMATRRVGQCFECRVEIHSLENAVGELVMQPFSCSII